MLIQCSEDKLAPGAKLLGSTGANASSGEATLEFSGCGVENNGFGCEIVGRKFKTEPLKLELAYLNNSRSGEIAMLLKPAKKHILAVAPLNGPSYCLNETAIYLYGDVAAVLQTSAEAPIEVGHEPAAAKKLDLAFPRPTKLTVWVEEKGSLVAQELELTANDSPSAVTGTTELELTTGATWGVFT